MCLYKIYITILSAAILHKLAALFATELRNLSDYMELPEVDTKKLSSKSVKTLDALDLPGFATTTDHNYQVGKQNTLFRDRHACEDFRRPLNEKKEKTMKNEKKETNAKTEKKQKNPNDVDMCPSIKHWASVSVPASSSGQ